MSVVIVLEILFVLSSCTWVQDIYNYRVYVKVVTSLFATDTDNRSDYFSRQLIKTGISEREVVIAAVFLLKKWQKRKVLEQI